MSEGNSVSWLLNRSYTNLLSRQRTYAAFSDWKNNDLEQNEKNPGGLFRTMIESGIDTILDPMSGYGTIMKYAQLNAANAVMLELNLPAHLWQVLTNPCYNSALQKTVETILFEERYPDCPLTFEVSAELISPVAFTILLELLEQNMNALSRFLHLDKVLMQKIALSMLLPFVMRLSTADKGDTTHIKKGGVCVLEGYVQDYRYYLKCMLLRMLKNCAEPYQDDTSSQMLESIYGDAVSISFGDRLFSGMLTSPPYPNGADYYKMFLPENYFLQKLSECGELLFSIVDAPIIGTNVVSGRGNPKVESSTAIQFLERLSSYKFQSIFETKRANEAKKAMGRYYIPYFSNYFSDIEQAYGNVSKYLNEDFLGYVVVTNNTARQKEVPVSDFIVDVWHNLGFNANSIAERELPHIGTKNPNTRGRAALHTEHVIKVWRGKYA